TEHIPVRPLPILIPIIADGLKQVRQNVTEIGKAMVEARGQLSYAAFLAWSQKNFRLKRTQTLYYLDIGKSGGTGPTNKERKRNQKKNKKRKEQRAAQSAANGNSSAAYTASAPTQADYQMGVQLIEAGFRALAKTLHPDKGGSQTAMTTLNRVRGRLKA